MVQFEPAIMKLLRIVVVSSAAIVFCGCGPSKQDLARIAAEQDFRQHIAEIKVAGANPRWRCQQSEKVIVVHRF
jgi:hypothetical protein